jgi:hypothetical protein
MKNQEIKKENPAKKKTSIAHHLWESQMDQRLT